MYLHMARPRARWTATKASTLEMWMGVRRNDSIIAKDWGFSERAKFKLLPLERASEYIT